MGIFLFETWVLEYGGAHRHRQHTGLTMVFGNNRHPGQRTARVIRDLAGQRRDPSLPGRVKTAMQYRKHMVVRAIAGRVLLRGACLL
jgi:hypothetical protein